MSNVQTAISCIIFGKKTDAIAANTAQNEAQKTLDQAIAEGGKAKQIEKAEKEMAKGQKAYDKGNYNKAIKHYEEAWKHYQRVMKK